MKEIEMCIDEHFAMAALGELEAALKAARENTDGSLDKMLPYTDPLNDQFDPRRDFNSPEGHRGPENPNGEVGKHGSLFINGILQKEYRQEIFE